MRKLSNLIGMPVICHRQKIGRLIRADLSQDLTRMEGVWVDAGLKGTRYIPAEQLGMIGEAVVLADNAGVRRRVTARGLLRRAVSTDGSRTGAIVGAEVDEISFLVCALELSCGFWEDLWFGRLPIRNYNAEQDEIIVSDPTHQSDREEEQ